MLRGVTQFMDIRLKHCRRLKLQITVMKPNNKCILGMWKRFSGDNFQSRTKKKIIILYLITYPLPPLWLHRLPLALPPPPPYIWSSASLLWDAHWKSSFRSGSELSEGTCQGRNPCHSSRLKYYGPFFHGTVAAAAAAESAIDAAGWQVLCEEEREIFPGRDGWKRTGNNHRKKNKFPKCQFTYVLHTLAFMAPKMSSEWSTLASLRISAFVFLSFTVLGFAVNRLMSGRMIVTGLIFGDGFLTMQPRWGTTVGREFAFEFDSDPSTP